MEHSKTIGERVRDRIDKYQDIFANYISSDQKKLEPRVEKAIKWLLNEEINEAFSRCDSCRDDPFVIITKAEVLDTRKTCKCLRSGNATKLFKNCYLSRVPHSSSKRRIQFNLSPRKLIPIVLKEFRTTWKTLKTTASVAAQPFSLWESITTISKDVMVNHPHNVFKFLCVLIKWFLKCK